MSWVGIVGTCLQNHERSGESVAARSVFVNCREFGTGQSWLGCGLYSPLDFQVHARTAVHHPSHSHTIDSSQSQVKDMNIQESEQKVLMVEFCCSPIQPQLGYFHNAIENIN